MTARLAVLLPLAAAAAVYALGWWRLGRRSPARLGPWYAARLGLGAGGLATLGVALLALDRAAHERFSAHMLQHLLLLSVAAPAILAADPLPAVLWALPARLRRRLPALLAARAPARRGWALLTRPALAWTLHAVVLWGWHWPAAYDRALADRALHDLEHLTLLAAGLLFWWPVLAPAPRLRPVALPARVVYLVLGAFQGGALGILLAATPTPLYAYAAPDALADQARGGVLMWAGAGAIDMLAVLLLVWRALAHDARDAPRFLDPSRSVRDNEPV